MQWGYLKRKMKATVVIWLQALALCASSWEAAAASMAKDGCTDKCGNVSVPYPFGIHKPNCAKDRSFLLECNTSVFPPILQMGNIQIMDISLKPSTAIVNLNMASSCYNSRDRTFVYKDKLSQLNRGDVFTFSATENKFTAVGCDTMAHIQDSEGMGFGSGCITVCYHQPNLTQENGCCRTAKIPKALGTLNISLSRVFIGSLDSEIRRFSPCSYAFLAQQNWNGFYNLDLSRDDIPRQSPVVLDWVVSNQTNCKSLPQASSSCGPNSYCSDSADAPGYRCFCRPGFQGNPYLPQGCEDIDECSDPKTYHCEGYCQNTIGNYTCTCMYKYFGKHEDGKARCRGFSYNSLPGGFGVATLVFFFISIGSWLHGMCKQQVNTKMKKKFFQRNGGFLLQQQISSNRTIGKMKLFMTEELDKATNFFNESRVLGKGGLGTVYKGMLADGSIVAIKKSNCVVDENQVGQFINEVIILCNISHRHIVKLLGCCLETEVPLLVYEYIPNGTLSQHLHCEDEMGSTMHWNSRLRIAGEVAAALAYLHSFACTAIFHRDIKSSNIILDQNYRAVVSDFGLSRSVPLHKTHLTTLVGGTFGYFDPEYFRSGQYTDKSDVYAFGVVLAELLTGEKAISSNKFDGGLVLYFRTAMKQNRLLEILKRPLVNEGEEDVVFAVATLAKRCIKLNGKKRPSMKEVAAELEQARRLQEQQLLEQQSLNRYFSAADTFFPCTIDAVEEGSFGNINLVSRQVGEHVLIAEEEATQSPHTHQIGYMFDSNSETPYMTAFDIEIA